MAAGYLDILRARHAARLLAGTLVGRLPNGTAHIAIDHSVQCRAGGGERVPGGAGAVGRGVEDHTEIVLGGDSGRAGVDAGEELVGEGRDDEECGAGAAETQAAGGEVRPVAEVPGAVAYAQGGGLGHTPVPFVAEHEGDGGL